MRPQGFAEWCMAATVAIILAVAICAGIASTIVDVQDGRARDRCFASAGRVEHYDADRPQVWRCVGARAEGE